MLCCYLRAKPALRKGWEQAAVGGVGAALCGRPLPTVGSCGQPDPERSEGMRPNIYTPRRRIRIWRASAIGVSDTKMR